MLVRAELLFRVTGHNVPDGSQLSLETCAS